MIPILLSMTCDAPRKRVWQALTDSVQRGHWWGPDILLAPLAGAEFLEPWTDSGGNLQRAHGQVLQADDASFLALLWKESAWHPESSSHVYISLDGDQKSTRIEVRHEAVPGFVGWDEVRIHFLEGWADWLARLKRHMHKGEFRSDNDLFFECALPMSPEEVFPLWTERDELVNWLCGDARVEPRTDGAYELFWDIERRDANSTLGCRVITSRPSAQLSFQWRGPEHHRIMEPPGSTMVEVTFAPKRHETLVRLTHTGFGRSPEWLDAREWQAVAWQRAFESLRDVYGE